MRIYHRGFALLLPPCKRRRSGAAIYRLAWDDFGIIVGKLLGGGGKKWVVELKVVDERVLEPSAGKEANSDLFPSSLSLLKKHGESRRVV